MEVAVSTLHIYSKKYTKMVIEKTLLIIGDLSLSQHFIENHIKYNILSNNQYGFRSKRNTQGAILKLSNEAYFCFNTSTPYIVSYLDLKKACDTLSHKKLFEKLKNIGIRGAALEL